MPLYLGNTKIDKFTVKIEGGAVSLEGNLTAITAPTKLVYDVGDSFDPREMKVVIRDIGASSNSSCMYC